MKWFLSIAVGIVLVFGHRHILSSLWEDHCQEWLKTQAGSSEHSMMSSEEIRACYGDPTVDAALNTYAQSIGLASEDELTSSQGHDALVAIAKGGFTDGNVGSHK
jgi:hypothetical protein